MERGQIAFVVGMGAEARLLRGSGFRVGTGGGTSAGATAMARQLIAGGARALVSFGLCGGLDPALRPGDLVIPAVVVDAHATLTCEAGLLAWLGGATTERLWGGDAIAVTAAEKAALFEQTKAAAIDLESGAVAGQAAAAGIPFAILRAVADPAGRNLPPAAVHGLDQSGRIALGRIAVSIFRQPTQIGGLIALAGDAGRARRALVNRLRSLA